VAKSKSEITRYFKEIEATRRAKREKNPVGLLDIQLIA
jgi:hypothetical protein